MTERKPAGVSWESWVDRQIREARERGEFDNLQGTGRRIANIEDPYDELWWVRQLIQRENLTVLPPALALRKARDEVLARIATMTDERRVRALLEELNEQIRDANRKPPPGPPTTLMPLDIDQALDAWRAGRSSSAGA